MNNIRFLKKHFPALEDNKNFPLNYKFTQLYTNITLDEQGVGLPFEDVRTVFVKAYQIPEFGLYPSFHKPISKFLEIQSNEKDFKRTEQ